jgi:predicted RNA binding protein YcfA (HicA-like mRNA interferase family)
MKTQKTGDFIKWILGLGYTEKPSHGGSHRVFKSPSGKIVSIPNHRELAPGTCRQITKIIDNDY